MAQHFRSVDVEVKISDLNHEILKKCMESRNETEWFSIDSVPYDSESNQPYYRLTTSDCIEVLALTANKEFILIRQFMPVLNLSLLELPSGNIDKNESPEAAAARELSEETGYVCDSLVYLGSCKIAPNRVNNTLDTQRASSDLQGLEIMSSSSEKTRGDRDLLAVGLTHTINETQETERREGVSSDAMSFEETPAILERWGLGGNEIETHNTASERGSEIQVHISGTSTG